MSNSSEQKQNALKQLRSVLLRLYNDLPSIRRIIDDSHLSTDAIHFDSQPVNIWYAILREADNRGRVDAIVQTAIEDYANESQVLQDALEAYLDAIAAPPANKHISRPSRMESQTERQYDEYQKKLIGILLDQIRSEGNANNLKFVTDLINNETVIQFDIETFHDVLKEKTVEWLELLESEKDYRALLRVAIIMIAVIARKLSDPQSAEIADTRRYFQVCKEKLMNSGTKDDFVDEILECLDSYPRLIFDEGHSQYSLL